MGTNVLWVQGCYLVPSTADRGSGVGQMSLYLKTKGGGGDTFDSMVYTVYFGRLQAIAFTLF